MSHIPVSQHVNTQALKAIVLTILACLCFSVLDAIAKYISHVVPVLQVIWMRFAVHAVLAVIIFRGWRKPYIISTKRPFLQIVRSLCLVGTTFGNFLALQHLQLAETMAITFAVPLLVTALAGPLLGEWAGPHRWAAIVVGFIGVLIVAQPGTGHMHWAVIYSIGATVLYSFYSILTRVLTGTDSPTSMIVISALVGACVMTPIGSSVWEAPPTYFYWALLLSTGVLGGFGHWIFIHAHRLAPAPVLAPFIYFQIVWMIVLGYYVFDDVPAPTTLIGAGLVVCSGLYVLYREQVKGRGKRNAPLV
ncbi:MAG: DMT family transporter [Rhodobacteraceae bacterium]|nr:DMT family transporter [Paracoccaceae bacterium]